MESRSASGSGSAAASSRAMATQSATRWSRCGRPTPPGDMLTRRMTTPRRSTRISPAPGAGRCLTDDEGRYRFVTVKPGAYPWRNHENAWRPAHIHFSLFGPSFSSRVVTQMYFPGDPLMPIDPIFQSIPDQHGRDLLVATLDLALTEPEWALGYRWDITLRGRNATPRER